ncbi:MAG: DoxX family protein [Methyloligella sp. ZOD6]
MLSSLDRYAPYALTALRIVAALLFMEHGTVKLFGFPEVEGHGAGGGSLPPLMLVAGILEVFGGLAILIGLFTRPIAFLLSGQMAVAYWMAHYKPDAFYPIQNGGDGSILFCFVFLYLFFAGPGAWAVDNLWKRNG